MPVGCVTWLSGMPDQTMIDRLLAQVLPITSEEEDAFAVIGCHWPTCLVSEKVIICGSSVYSCTVREEVVSLVPDQALNISRLIWMCDAECVTVNELTLQNIQEAMSI